MTYQEALIPLLEEVYGELFKNAEKLSDKLDFKASETSRTPLEMVNECVCSPIFLAETIGNQALAPMDEETWERPGITSLADCKAAWEAAKGPLYDAIRSFPAEKLEEQIVTPWGTFTWLSFIAYCYWNPAYHVGQLAYIQMMHGDTEMSF